MGQYSLLLVATETVVLLLPRIMGTNMDPCVFGSLAMRSFIISKSSVRQM